MKRHNMKLKRVMIQCNARDVIQCPIVFLVVLCIQCIVTALVDKAKRVLIARVPREHCK